MSPSAPSSAPPPLASGDRVADRYEIEDVIGEGASGVVYVARSIDGAERVALKVIHRHLLRDRQIKGRFHREARLLEKLSGEHLVPLLDFGEAGDGLLFMALELVEGKALDELMPVEQFSPERATHIMLQVCSALRVAHDAGIVHRDLKPGNVLIERTDDGSDHVRVLDFGMAKLLRGDASDSITALTEQNMVFGTPQYMAPEQARGEEVDARCDVYAAGVILYEMLTGAPPFDGTTPIGVMTAHLVDEPDPPSSRAPDAGIPPALEAVTLYALHKLPRERYSSAEELARALERSSVDPMDVSSTAPPAHADPAFGDTDLDLEGPRVHRARAVESEHGAGADRHWILVGIVAALVGIAAGVATSLLGGP